MTILSILQLGNLIAVLGPLTLELALKIKALLTLSPDFTVNIQELSADAIAADDDTIAAVNAWLAAQNLPQAGKL